MESPTTAQCFFTRRIAHARTGDQRLIGPAKKEKKKKKKKEEPRDRHTQD